MASSPNVRSLNRDDSSSKLRSATHQRETTNMDGTSTSPNARPLHRATSSSKLIRSPSGRLLSRSSSSFRESTLSSKENIGDSNAVSAQPLPSTNSHLQLKNYRPSSAAITAAPQSTSFFVMVTGQIESSTASLGDKLYCRYSFSYGEDWNVVHGVSMGLSQLASQGMISNSTNDDEVVVWNFPIEISFQSTNPQGWPRLALSIYGLDFLGRDVLRGYASLMLPVSSGRHSKYLKTYKPVSGSKFVEFVNYLFGTPPEYYDSKMVTRGEGRAVTRVVSGDRKVKINLMVTVKDLTAYGYVSSTK